MVHCDAEETVSDQVRISLETTLLRSVHFQCVPLSPFVKVAVQHKEKSAQIVHKPGKSRPHRVALIFGCRFAAAYMEKKCRSITCR